MSDVMLSIQHLLRDAAPQVLSALSRRCDDFAAAEDAVQEALIAATEQWPADGVPANPKGWLYYVAMRRLRDAARSESARRRREEAVARSFSATTPYTPAPDEDAPEREDDALVLLYMCCHPALSTTSAIALTLRAVGGLTTAEIARAFFVPEATMAQRISRAKQTIKSSGVAFAMPDAIERDARLHAVLHVLYLLFNEGYASVGGEAWQRPDLANEAIRLTRAVHQWLPNDPEVGGLLALMLLTDARRDARTGPHGEIIPLDEQDRSRWHTAQIQEGVALISRMLSRGTVGVYQLQAAIAAVHDEAPSAEATDWRQIEALYALLLRMGDNPMARLSHAIAMAMVHGPHAGLKQLEMLESDARLRGHYRVHAARAHLLERTGAHAAARDAYTLAADQTTSLPERHYLLSKIARLSSAS